MEIISKLINKLIIILFILIIELMLFIHKLKSHNTHPITTPQFLKFIEEKHPTICYTKRMKLYCLECSVCLCELKEGDKVRNLKCKHTFHKHCLDQWLLQEYYATCPLCRKKLLPDDVVLKHHQHLLQVQVDHHVVDESDEQLPFLLHVLRSDRTFSYRFH
ncbi:unnamed protein product [Lupinus luteus]|uniref:RING-type domain-containing protein n=1 Tax=Lupinus luteus TaxID=3873 RepID=A0AAV1Y207_LUPLU